MHLGELEDGVSAEELLLEVLGDNNKEMETAEEVEATMAEDRVTLDRTDNNDNADNGRLNITLPCDNDECQTLEELSRTVFCSIEIEQYFVFFISIDIFGPRNECVRH